jgi:hypothetical protein
MCLLYLMCHVRYNSVASDGALCCMYFSLACELDLQTKVTLSAKSPKCLYLGVNSLYFGVKVQLPELLHAVTVKAVAMLLLTICKTVRA